MPDEFQIGESTPKKGPPRQENIRRWRRFKVEDAAAVVLYPEKLLNFMFNGPSLRGTFGQWMHTYAR